MNNDNYPEVTHEENYKGFTIFIENNPDQYNGGYEYSVIEDESEIESGLVFTLEDGLKEAKEFIDSL